MNFLQLHEQLRLELLRRIKRGVLSGTLLARQTGLKAAHISNFLHRKRHFSLDALDRVLSAQSISIEELLDQAPGRHASSRKQNMALSSQIALISQSVAILDPQIHESSILELIQLPPGYLDHLPPRRSSDRRSWERFVAVRASYLQAEAMASAIVPHSILVIDRHYNSLVPYRPPMPSIYAIQRGSALIFRYATLQGKNIILRPHKIEHPVELIEMKPGESPSSFVVGRICLSISEM
ncbi:MAG TPA: helix-turn-helix domain-containing protein [Alloacidobacterium sp.]|jgi:transcriptional regulator with XRE-family HTH domain|nr:helix-turn-helix domain-containing protein [Alloacidobacterium sp.]